MKKIGSLLIAISIFFSTAIFSIVDVYALNSNDVVEYSKQWIGTPYVYGGTSLTTGIDCGAFICRVYEKFGVNL